MVFLKYFTFIYINENTYINTSIDIYIFLQLLKRSNMFSVSILIIKWKLMNFNNNFCNFWVSTHFRRIKVF